MKRLFVVTAMVMMTAAMVAAGDGEKTSYGEGVTLASAVPIVKLLGSPDDFVGKKIRVDGVITGVCKKRGCWMQVSDPDTGEGVRVKVEDGVMVFPYTAMGHRAAAEGVFEAIKLSPEQVQAMKAQQAAAHKKEHSTSSGEADQHAGCARDGSGKHDGHEAKDDCKPKPVKDTIYLIRGTGAIIHS